VPQALIVDDDLGFALSLAEAVGREGFEAATAGSVKDARRELAATPPDVLITDLQLPDGSGMDLIAHLEGLPDTQVILVTGHASVETAVDALRRGVADYLTKPVDFARIKMMLGNLARTRELKEEIGSLRKELRRLGRFGPVVGGSPAMQRVYDLVARVAPTDASILVTGETGTGKELVARAVHDLSPRSNKPYVAVNCSALPASLLEAELFGHTKGSFTGAVQSRRGLIEEAAGGTLFLDEISTLTEDMQVKLLRVLQDRRVQRIGSNSPVPVDFRLVVATNTDLAGLVSDGRFREDLFFRLDVFPIVVPPLRQRREDIPLLATHFLARFGDEHGLEPPRLAPATLSRMSAYDWPGNVRELENLVERSVITHAGRESFPFDLPHGAPHNAAATLLGQAIDGEWTLERLEREYLLATLAGNHWQQGAGAKILGINRRTIYRKLKRYREDGHLPDVDID
jgi:DNA-binding NtrC family response regulator